MEVWVINSRKNVHSQILLILQLYSVFNRIALQNCDNKSQTSVWWKQDFILDNFLPKCLWWFGLTCPYYPSFPWCQAIRTLRVSLGCLKSRSTSPGPAPATKPYPELKIGLVTSTSSHYQQQNNSESCAIFCLSKFPQFTLPPKHRHRAIKSQLIWFWPNVFVLVFVVK